MDEPSVAWQSLTGGGAHEESQRPFHFIDDVTEKYPSRVLMKGKLIISTAPRAEMDKNTLDDRRKSAGLDGSYGYESKLCTSKN
jgi:hypothetical protein